MERITDAFAWPARDPDWLAKLLVIGLILLIPFVGSINGLGWMLASLDRLRAGEEKLAPANLRYIGRGFPLFVVDLVYGLVIAAIAAVIYVPALIVASNQSQGSANPALISLAMPSASWPSASPPSGAWPSTSSCPRSSSPPTEVGSAADSTSETCCDTRAPTSPTP